jgi:hypothetical protein
MNLTPEQYLSHLVSITKALIETGDYTGMDEEEEGLRLAHGDPEVASPLVTDAAERILFFLTLGAERAADEQGEKTSTGKN